MLAWLLTTKNSNPYKRTRFIEEAKKIGLTLLEVTPSDVIVLSSQGENYIVWSATSKRVTHLPDFVISLAVVEKKDPDAFILLEHLHSMGIYTLNSPQAIRAANNKMHTYQKAVTLKIPIPHSTLVTGATKLEKLKTLFPLPVVCKPNIGLKGEDVTLIQTQTEFSNYYKKIKAPTIVQEAITESAGRDARILLLGGKILGCLERSSNDTFTSNVATGAKGKAITLPESCHLHAKNIAKEMHLFFCSVDFLFSKKDLVLCEVNANPGFTMFESATQKNVARSILEFCREHVSK